MVGISRYLTLMLVFTVVGGLVTAGRAAPIPNSAEGVTASLVKKVAAAVTSALKSDPSPIPPPRALLFLMAHDADTPGGAAGRTVSKLLTDLADSPSRDREAGGFRRGEGKPIGLNAELLRTYATAYRVFDDETFGEVARKLADFVAESCRTGEDVEELALGVSALFEATPVMGDESLPEAALKRLLENPSITSGSGMVPAETVRVVEALLSAYEYTGKLRFREQAEELFRPLREEVESASSLATSGEIALTAMRLSYMTGDKTYAPLAEKILNGLREQALSHPLEAGAWGRAAVYHVTHPYKAIVIGQETARRALHDGVLRLPLVNRVVLTVDPAKDPEELKRLKYPDMGKPVVFLCTDRMCSMPIDDAEDLAKTLAKLRGRKRAY